MNVFRSCVCVTSNATWLHVSKESSELELQWEPDPENPYHKLFHLYRYEFIFPGSWSVSANMLLLSAVEAYGSV